MFSHTETCFIHFLNNQIDVIVGKSLVKHIYSIALLITVLKIIERFLKGYSAKELLSILN